MAVGFSPLDHRLQSRGTIRETTLLLFLPQGPNPKWRSELRKSGFFPVCAGGF
jgi:hypothetical protein